MDAITFPLWFYLGGAFGFGACFGSFLNVCIYRIPAKKSIVSPPSTCPKCNTLIAWYDNIPILAWCYLGGKCRKCKNPIPVRYALIELLTGLLFVIYMLAWLQGYVGNGSFSALLVHYYLLCVLIVGSFTDIDEGIIPHRLTVPAICLGPVLCFAVPDMMPVINHPWFEAHLRINAMLLSISGICLGAGLTIALYYVGYLFIRFKNKLAKSTDNPEDAIGFGDVTFMATIGAYVGPLSAFMVFYLSPMLAAPIGLGLLLLKGQKLLRYGPYIALAAICVVLGQEPLLRWLSMGGSP